MNTQLSTRIHGTYDDYISSYSGVPDDLEDGIRERDKRIVCIEKAEQRRNIRAETTECGYRCDFNSVHQFGDLRHMSKNQISVAADHFRIKMATETGMNPANIVLDPFPHIMSWCAISTKFKENLIALVRDLGHDHNLFFRTGMKHFTPFVPWRILSNHAILIFEKPKFIDLLIDDAITHRVPFRRMGVEFEYLTYREHLNMGESYRDIRHFLTLGVTG